METNFDENIAPVSTESAEIPEVTDEYVQEVYKHAVKLKAMGKSREEIQADLFAKGLDTESASLVMGNVDKLFTDAKKSAAQKDIVYGILWLVGGFIVAAVAMFASEGSGRVFILYGPVVYGLVRLIKGLIGMASK